MKIILNFVFLLSVLLITFSFPSLHSVSAEELDIQNPGFEDPSDNGVIPGWTQNFGTTGITTVESEFYSGKKSLEIIDTNKTDNPGLISNKVPVTPGKEYTASAKIKTGSTGAGEIYIRFFDQKDAYITGFNKSITGATTWSDISITAIAPANAASAAILFYSGKGNIGTFYFDDASLMEVKPINPIEQVAENLGIQVTKTTVMLGDIGKDSEGNDVLYTVVAGIPSKFAIVDVATEKLIKSYTLEDTSGAWGVKVAADGSVYLGAYNKGFLYRYLPQTDELINLGHPVKDTDAVLYPFATASDGKIYGGTYGSGSVYEYNPSTNKFTDFGRMAAGQSWVRSVAFDERNQKVYAGVGSQAHLIEYDIATGEKRNVLPAQYSDIISVYDMNLIDGKLFAQKESKYEMFIYDTETGNLVEATNGDTGEKTYDIPESSRGVSEKSPIANKVYFTHMGILHEYNLDTKTFKSLNVDLKGSAISYKFVQLNEAEFPGYTLVGLSGNGGQLYKYNLVNGNLTLTNLDLPSESVLIHELAKGPDGKIYSTGYLPGNMSAFFPTTNATVRFDGIGQSEGIATLNNKMYLGIYPNAKIYEYDPFKAWDRTDSNNLNPDLLFSLERNDTIPGYTQQDRPFAMLGVDDYNRLFIGTVPKNGNLGGAFTIYEPGTEKEPQIYWNLMKDQSIVSLAYANGKVYGGTTVAGGQGSIPTTTEAKLFVWDIEKQEKSFEIVPVAGKRALTALTVGPDGNIWGMSDGTLFAFDPVTNNVIYQKEIDPKASSSWRNASLETGTDGNIYGIIGNKFFKFDLASNKHEFLASGVEHLAQDDFGAFYLSKGINLYKYEDSSLLQTIKSAELSVSEQRLTVGDTASLHLKAILNNNRSTYELAGSTIEYIVSNPKMISISNGILTAQKSGRANITVKVTLNGVTVDSNVVSVWVNNKGGNNK
ncbi:Carbohydrate binding domain-containing protein [Psychrobacillus sp. OK028]|uniref:carbohydrate binding domain-containing protein n=1 Tax=Psychrobacillus sp. OK028 TaxID=1884359 RepID=UPI00087F6E3A|nr:carbohydrate binding domain-containing protein [Psychrobacillus sp. OK028]SDM38911.1 Carbohydrate binding domain-containing protein [Psychrobacillus sp. OK028]